MVVNFEVHTYFKYNNNQNIEEENRTKKKGPKPYA